MFGLTSLGVVHTAFSLVALIAGYGCLLRHGRVNAPTALARVYLWCTVITCLTAFGIFRHGGFNVAHGLALITLATLAVALLARRTRVLGRFSPYVETLGFTATLFFHMIPGLNETFSRLPVGAPLFTGPDDPAFKQAVNVVLLVFVVIMAVQAWRIHKGDRVIRMDSSAGRFDAS